MENVSNVSSEEELLELLNEGKITKEEYDELLETLRKSAKVDAGEGLQDKPKPTQTSGLAIASLIFSLVVPIGCIPAVICGHLALGKMKKEPALQGRGLALAGLIVGYIILGLFIVAIIYPSLLWLSYKSPPVAIDEVTELKRYPLDNMEGIISQTGLQIDKEISSDGNGSLRIEAAEDTTIRLFETGDMDIENARLIYQAVLRTQNLQGKAYLEMWCHFPDSGEYFSKGLYSPLTGSTDWVTQEIPFFLKKGENPDNVKLNLVIEGKGTVWIDDIRLLKSAMPNY